MALRSRVLNPPPLEGTGSYTFPDGSHYEGAWSNFLPNGNGTFTWPNGTVYKGSFKAGTSDGNGTLSIQSIGKLPYFERGAACTLMYSGGFSDGRANGEGTIKFPLDEMRTAAAELQTCFEGSFTDGAASGSGVFRFPTANETGEWLAGEFVAESSVRKPLADGVELRTKETAPDLNTREPAPHEPMQEGGGGTTHASGRESGYAYDDFEESGSALANGSSSMSPPSMGSIAQRRSLRMGAVEPHYSIGEQANAPLDEEEEAHFEEAVPASGEDPDLEGTGA